MATDTQKYTHYLQGDYCLNGIDTEDLQQCVVFDLASYTVILIENSDTELDIKRTMKKYGVSFIPVLTEKDPVEAYRVSIEDENLSPWEEHARVETFVDARRARLQAEFQRRKAEADSEKNSSAE